LYADFAKLFSDCSEIQKLPGRKTHQRRDFPPQAENCG
jgi:hypothetical protein